MEDASKVMAMNMILNQYAGDRCLSEEVEKELDARLTTHDGTTIWRGLPYLTENIKAGEIVNEWYGASHWSLKKDVSIKFSSNYISEGLIEDIVEERNIEWDEAEKLFSPLLMQIEDTHIPVVDLFKHIDHEFEDEQEVLIRGYDFRIKEVVQIGDIYVSKVEPVKQAA